MRMNEIVGDWLQGYRANHGLTLDQIADASHRYGTNWGNVNVSRMEKGGSKADALPTLMILLATLNDLTGDELTMADVFIDYAGTVDIGDYATSYENVVSALQGDNVSFRHTHADTLKQLLEEDERDRERLLEEHPEWAEYLAEERERDGDGMRFSKHVVSATRPPMFDTSADRTEIRIVANHLPTAAEARMERRMSTEGVFARLIEDYRIRGYDDGDLPEGFSVAAVCDVLYGHSLDEEAAKRAGEGATPQKRGRVTRVLAGEILDYMRKVAAKLED
jgi:transcriptional regulator with XRE-family HTH domain